jgi:hypothetical protein
MTPLDIYGADDEDGDDESDDEDAEGVDADDEDGDDAGTYVGLDDDEVDFEDDTER